MKFHRLPEGQELVATMVEQRTRELQVTRRFNRRPLDFSKGMIHPSEVEWQRDRSFCSAKECPYHSKIWMSYLY